MKRIRQALTSSTPVPFPASEGNQPVFKPSTKELEIEFAERFAQLQGKFVYCTSKEEAADAINQLATARNWDGYFVPDIALQQQLHAAGARQLQHPSLAEAPAAITNCELLVARTGSIVLSSAQTLGRTASVYTPVHICIATTRQLVYDIKDGIIALKQQYGSKMPSLISLATGPSRTADIEKTLVVGVHGPKEVFLLLIDEP